MRPTKDELSIFTSSGQNRLQGLSNQTAKALQNLRQIARNKPIMVAIAPPAFVIDQTRTGPALSLVGLNPDEATVDAPQQKIIQILKQQNIPYCDLTTALREGQKTQQMRQR